MGKTKILKWAHVKSLQFKECKACGSDELVRCDVDTFCMDCDWNSVLMDVDCGNFEKRIAIMNRQLNQQNRNKFPFEATENLEKEIVA